MEQIRKPTTEIRLFLRTLPLKQPRAAAQRRPPSIPVRPVDIRKLQRLVVEEACERDVLGPLYLRIALQLARKARPGLPGDELEARQHPLAGDAIEGDMAAGRQRGKAVLEIRDQAPLRQPG